MDGLISGMVVVVIRLNEFIFVDATAKTQEIRHLIFRLLQDVSDNGQRFISVAYEENWSDKKRVMNKDSITKQVSESMTAWPFTSAFFHVVAGEHQIYRTVITSLIFIIH